MSLHTPEPLLISLSDVSRLAHVQRPVVSMWRTRFAESETPFPPTIATVDRVVQFDAESVVSWLEQTGLGNNTKARQDVAAFARPAGSSLPGDEAHLRAVTALLCLKAVAGVQLAGLRLADLLDLAEEADPDDDFLFAEVAGLAGEVPALAGYVDRLADAAYTPAKAFEGLMADRFRQRRPGHAETALRDDARRLVAGVAQGLAQAADLQPPVFVDPTCGGSDLLIEVAALYAEGPSPTVMTTDDDAEICRLVRRRLRVHDLHREPLVMDQHGSFEVSGPAVHLAHFPSAGAPSMTEVEILSAVDNIVLQMDESQLGVVIAPASVLADRLASEESDQIRDGLLRSDRVRAVLRLPKGLLVSASRQPFALWALGPPHPDVRIADRWTVVADLADVALDESAIEDIVTDVVAAMGNHHAVRSHQFRFSRRVETRSLLARGGALVDSVVRFPRKAARTGADIAVRVEQLIGALQLTALSVEAAGSEVPDRADPLTLGRLLDHGAVRLVPGNRLAEAHLGADSGASVIGSAELTGSLPWDGRRVDRLVFAASYAAGRLTEPGDVVFCTTPRVAARVDVEGGSVVLSPARALRATGGDGRTAAVSVVPQVLAADINAVASRATQWRLWPVRLAPVDQATALAEVLCAIEREREATLARLAQLDELAGLLADGVTSHGVTIPENRQQRSGDPPDTAPTAKTPSDQTRQRGR
jgi:hypothetical protein